MAVYTTLTPDDFAAVLRQYDCGDYVSHQGITGGIENTNYFLTTTHRTVVLTVFERLSHAQLPFYLSLAAHLGSKGVRAAAPIATTAGGLCIDFNGKPLALTVKLNGKDTATPTPSHAAAVGSLLAQMHNAVADFDGVQPNLRGLDWLSQTVPSLFAYVPAAIAGLLADELMALKRWHASADYAVLPRGAAHCDLFLDNVLFDQAQQPGAIDFYFAGVDALVFDLAVTLNDWCVLPDKTFCPEKTAAFLSAYQAVRSLSALEKAALPQALRAAALRFWVSRLDDWYKPRAASQLVAKDPTHFEQLLQTHRAHPDLLNPYL